MTGGLSTRGDDRRSGSAPSRVAVVTGGASGIGLRFARALGFHGYRVVVADLDGADDAAASLCSAGLDCIGVRMDVSVESDVAAMVAAAHRSFGGIDILVNNAALFSTLKLRSFEEIPATEWAEVMRINTLGPFLCAKAVVPAMRARGFGRIVNMASTVALKGVPNMLHYVASKGAVIALTRALARELGPAGITVNAIAPGFTLSDGILANKVHEVIGDAARRTSRSIQRDQTPDDLVSTLLYLVADDTGFVSGQTIVVDGGSAFN